MVVFHSYLSLPEGKSHQITMKPPFSHGFPMVFQRVKRPPSGGPVFLAPGETVSADSGAGGSGAPQELLEATCEAPRIDMIYVYGYCVYIYI